MSGFAFRKLDAWRVSVELAEEIRRLVAAMPEGHEALADQLRRAVTSVSLNIAEGAGRWSGRDKAYRYAIARGECAEVAAALEVAVALGALAADATTDAIAKADRVGAMLTRLIQSSRARAR